MSFITIFYNDTNYLFKFFLNIYKSIFISFRKSKAFNENQKTAKALIKCGEYRFETIQSLTAKLNLDTIKKFKNNGDF
jgi:hypothetical protein